VSAQIVPVKNAKLPVNYERAREALEKCEQIDECKDWADKAAAMASYAKQADDDSLFKTATRIKGRAIRRCGELLKAIEKAKPGPRPKCELGSGAVSQLSPRQAVAEAAGLSQRQQNDALRIASIPKREFEKAIEAEKPPTLTALAKQGTKPATPRHDHLKGRKPDEFNASIKARGAMRDMADMCDRVTPGVAVRGAADYDLPKMKAWAKTIAAWITRLETELKK
jgi:hypothetical protein